MKTSCAKLTAAAAALFFAGSACADTPLLYTFEQLYNGLGNADPAGTRPDDFHPNGGGAITQDTIGATEQTHSMKFVQATSDTLTGAETELLPDHLNDDNSVITMDVTIPAGSGQFTGAFANVGITEFGFNPVNGSQQAQVVSEAETSIAFQPGTYHVGVPLIARSNPNTGDARVSFASIFGNDPNTQMVPADWEIFINKTGDSALTAYIDNVRIIQMLTGDANSDGVVNALDFNAIASNFGTAFPLFSRGDLNFDGHVNTGDFMIMANNFGQHLPPSSPGLGSVVPEPGAATMLLAFAVAVTRRRKSRVV